MLYEAVCTTKELMEGGTASSELLVLRAFLKYLKPVLERNIESAANGAPVIGTHFAVPLEMYSSFDVVPIVFEVITYTLAALLPEGVEKYYDISESWGHPYHTCTSQKGVMGMTIDELFDFDVLATPTAPCDNSIGSYPVIQNLIDHNLKKKVPLILADMPIYRNERGYKYFAGELIRMRDEIGKAIGQKPDEEKFRKSCEIANQNIAIISDLNELKKLKPCPVESMTNPLMTGIMAYMAGQPERISCMEEILDIAKMRAKNKERAQGGEEKLRTLFPNMSVFFDLGFCEWLDRELGMTVLFDIFNYLFFDKIDLTSTESMFDGLAIQSMEYPMVRHSGMLDLFINDYVFLAKEYEMDCVIMTSHAGCKQFHSVVQLLREALRDELDIPLLQLELDVGDKRISSIDSIKKEIENFVNTLL